VLTRSQFLMSQRRTKTKLSRKRAITTHQWWTLDVEEGEFNEEVRWADAASATSSSPQKERELLY